MKMRCVIRKRGVSSIIAGLIVLSIFITASIAMLTLSQQNDTYRSAVAARQQRDIDMFQENLVGVYPGLSNCQNGCTIYGSSLVPVPPSGINQYLLNISNYAGIDAKIVRVYINSSQAPGCYPVPCVLDPSTTPTQDSFRMSDSLVNPGEFGHQVVIWLPSTVTLPPSPPPTSTISVATSRGRTFTLQFPFPQVSGTGGRGATGLNLGPLLIQYESDMITYAIYNGSNPNTYPRPIYNNVKGGWMFPVSTPLIFFIKIYNQGLSAVTLVSESSFQIVQFGAAGSVQNFFLAAPMDTGLCAGTFQQLDPYGELTYCGPGGSISGGNTAVTKTGGIVGYSSNGQYIIPTPPQPGSCCSPPVWLLFSAKVPAGSDANSISNSPSANPSIYYTYLNLVFQYNDGGGSYTYAVDLPFIVFCAGSGAYTSSCPVSEV